MKKGRVMEATTTLVLILTAGVIALLVWFEINSRRNENREKSQSVARPELCSPPDTQRRSVSEKNRKAA